MGLFLITDAGRMTGNAHQRPAKQDIMPEETQTEHLNQGSPEQIDATGPGVPTPPPDSEPESPSAPAASSAPAATARAYHDIIAERLARKNPAAAAPPEAHSSDVA